MMILSRTSLAASGCTLAVFLCISAVSLSARVSTAQDAGTRYALLVGGLGGNPTYTEQFGTYLGETRALLVDRYGIQEDQVHVLGENAVVDRSFVDDVSSSDNIRSYFDRLSRQVTPDDHVYVILFGHGSYDGARTQLNIPRRDLDDEDFGALLDGLDAGRIIFINTASASGPFTQTLSGPDRIVITATATGTQRDETVFPRYFIEALRSVDADLDKSGGLSVLEVFRYASGEAARAFEAAGQLATEHALLEDSGDGEGVRHDEIDGSSEGALASITFLRPPDVLANVDEADRSLLRERETLQRSIAGLKSRKSEMDDDAYYAELESLLVQLAQLNERLESGP